MSAFFKQAEEIFATARAPGAEDAELAVLVDEAGGVRVLAAGGWDAEALRLDRGARSVFRISRFGGRVRLEGRTASQRCVLESVRPPAAVRDFACYAVVPASDYWRTGRNSSFGNTSR